MRPTNYLPEPSLLLAPLALLVAPAFAQNNGGNTGGNDGDNTDNNNNGGNNGGNGNNNNNNPPANTRPTSNNDDNKSEDGAPNDLPAKPTKPAPADESKSGSSKSEPTADSKSEDKDKDQSKSEEKTSSSKPQAAVITQTGDPEPTAADSDIPRITGPSQTSGDDDGGLVDGPTLTKNPGIPTYPAAAVPPTINAPFMKHSSAPDGTVFIAVGAILGAFGLALLLWRVISGILLHRSVERAAMAQHDVNNKTGFPAPPAPFYKYTDHGSTMSLGGGAAAAGRGVRRTNRGPIPSSNPSQSNLFFSPTAANPGTAGNRGSSFLPSGFYAAGNSSPGAGGHGHSISLTNLRPDSRGHAGNPSRTPPDSPGVMARRDMSTSSLNLNRPPSQRAPSAYLDDLLADDPSALPPPQMPPSRGVRHPSNLSSGPTSPTGRF